MVFYVLIFAALAALVYFLYKCGTKNDNVFIERGLKFKKPTFFFGNSAQMMMKRMSSYEFFKTISKDFPNEKLLGYFDFRDPVVVVLDPEILKELAVTEFYSFMDHKEIFTEESDRLFGNSLFSLQGQKWRDMRATLSPAFTGSKMRLMCDFIVEICEQMVNYLKIETIEKENQVHEVKELLSKLATDIIGTCAFGIKVDSLKDDSNHFYKAVKKTFNFTNPLVIFKFMLYRCAPKLMQKLGISVFNEGSRNFMKSLVIDTMKMREEKNIIRPDMIHLLMEAQKGNLIHSSDDKDTAGFATVEESEVGLIRTRRKWNDDEIVAQCFLFFLAGLDTPSTALSFLIYELIVHQDIQDKLYEEVSSMDKDLAGKSLNYEKLQELKYLDMVISEGLRKWPPSAITDRVCNRDFTLKYNGNKEYNFHKGDVFWLPIVNYHHNPKFFPDPEIFDPERFSPENRASVNVSAFIPFGIGPRNCIGSRFALMEMKSILYYLILNFHMEPSEKTHVPIKLVKSPVALQAENGINVKFRPRIGK